MPEVPRFEGFFKSLSEDKNALEDEKYNFEDEEGKK